MYAVVLAASAMMPGQYAPGYYPPPPAYQFAPVYGRPNFYVRIENRGPLRRSSYEYRGDGWGGYAPVPYATPAYGGGYPVPFASGAGAGCFGGSASTYMPYAAGPVSYGNGWSNGNGGYAGPAYATPGRGPGAQYGIVESRTPPGY